MGEYPLDNLNRSKCHEQTIMVFPPHTLQAKMQIRSIPFSEGRKLNLNVSKFTLHPWPSAKGPPSVQLAMVTEWQRFIVT